MKTISLVQTPETTKMQYKDEKGETVELEDIPLYKEDPSNGAKYVTLADLLQAEERRIAKKHGITEYNIFEMVALFADVKSRVKGIKQKFRFNKILFYIGKRLETAMGQNALIFDEMGAARAGPIPVHLTADLKQLKARGLIDVYVEWNGKKIPSSSQNWEELVRTRAGSCVVILTDTGEQLARRLAKDLDPEIMEIILQTKEEFIYMSTEDLRNRVHAEYPELRRTYTENDTEDFHDACASSR